MSLVTRILRGLGVGRGNPAPPPDGELVDHRGQIASNAELEALCLAAPDAAAPWEVYADWLMAQGDPRGEIAALHAGGKPDAANRLLDRHRPLLLGGVADNVRELHWRHGFARGARLRIDLRGKPAAPLETVAVDFLAQPIAQFVDALRFGIAGYGDANDWGPVVSAIAASPHGRRVRELRFDDYTADESELSWTPFGDFSKLDWSRLPALELLHIRSGSGGALGSLVIPSLRTFIRESGGLGADEIEAICRATWPRLEHLAIWFGDAHYGAAGSPAAIEQILAAEGLPALTHLGLVNCEFSDDLIPVLAASKLLPQLRTLDLSKGVIARDAAAALVAHAAAFRHLEAIDLDENLLDTVDLDAIAAVLPQVVHTDQRADDLDDGMRYVAVGE